MATLISPGVSVTVTDQSFYIPASAPTVPLILIATAEDKTQPDGVSAAIGTMEHHVVRTVTSLTQSIQLYGIPRFLETFSGQQHHGDARNEYGLKALNDFLGVGNRAYVVRANVNLNDDRDHIDSMWTNLVTTAASELEQIAQAYIDTAGTTAISSSQLLAIIEEVMEPVFKRYNFSSTPFKDGFMNNHGPSGDNQPLVVDDGDDGVFLGVAGEIIKRDNNPDVGLGEVADEWTPEQAKELLEMCRDDFADTVEFLNYTSLGANDAARRSAIVTALQAAANLDVLRAEAYEFNLIVCPGYYELADELVALATDIGEEAMVIGDIPMHLDPDAAVDWAMSSSQGRVFSNTIAYYYGNGYGSNLDGKNVLGSSSGVALRTIAYSDNASHVWFAPAGTQRGVVTGVTQVGYFTGTPGTATTFVEAVLNVGIRDNMYKDGTNINPITFMPGRGIIVMGQKTSAPVASALDRINVVRLLAHIRRALRKNAFAFVFEPNDQLTRDNLKAMADGFLGDIVTKRGLYDFATQCDESNNTPDRIDRSEMYLDIALKPVKAAEFIYIPIRVVSTGADI